MAVLLLFGISFVTVTPRPSLAAAPPVTALISPVGAIFTPTPTYAWNAVPQVTFYYLWVNDSTGVRIVQWYRSTDVGCGTGIGTCSVTPSTVLTLGSAKWWVQTFGPDVSGPWSTPLDFTITLPGRATLVAPTGSIDTTTPTYIWNAVTGATSYYLWVSDSTGVKIQQWYRAADAGCDGAPVCSVTPDTALAPGSAAWWIQTSSPAGTGPWSMEMPFSVAPLPRSNFQGLGSVIVFPKFIRGRVLVDGVTEPQSSFEISVTCPAGSVCPEGQPVKIRFHWVCPPGAVPNVCRETDFIVATTVKGTVVFNPERLMASDSTTVVPLPSCPRGYLIGWVVDVNDQPIKFDALIGDAVLRHSATSVASYTGIPIQAAASLHTGDLTDVNHDGALEFDGTEYQAATGKIYSTVRFDHPPGVGGTPTVRETDLTLLTLDVRSDRVNTLTFADLNFYDAFENLVGTSTAFICWTEVSLSAIDPNLIDVFQGSVKGLLESADVASDDAGNPRTLLGIVETLESPPAGGPVREEHAYELFNDSVPIPTTFVPR